MGSAPQRSSKPLDNHSSMAETPIDRSESKPEDDSSPNGARPFEELRHLILAPEQEAIERLHTRVANPEARTEDVSSVVAEAIHLRRQQGGSDALSNALTPVIESALRESVRKDPVILADALFPVMGPAIRRSILETLRSYLESFNQIMDRSLSLQGLKWRFEALRTGRSFAEVVLLHSLVFRVEQVFLIHKKSGLPISHLVAPAVAIQDPSLVSGMLSAIQDFVRDSFHTSQGQGINRMNIGDLDVWVEDGPYAILALVIRGVPPHILRDKMAESLENIHREYSDQLGHFTGDSSDCSMVNPELSRCLDSEFKENPKPTSYKFVWAAAAFLVLVVGGWLGYRWWQFHRWSELVSKLQAQPGLVVTSFGRDHGKFVIRGLRDPLAPDPQQFVRESQLSLTNAEFHWGAYYALDDAIVQQRAIKILAPPSGSSLAVNNGILTVVGQLPAHWLEGLQDKALLIPGIRAVDFGPSTPEQLAFLRAKTEIESFIVEFRSGSAAIDPAESAKIRTLLTDLKEILNTPAEMHGHSVLEVVGHSDASGPESTNQNLSRRRADRVVWELIQLGIPDGSVRAKGVAAAEPVRPEDSEENRQYNRSVTFRVLSSPATSKP